MFAGGWGEEGCEVGEGKWLGGEAARYVRSDIAPKQVANLRHSRVPLCGTGASEEGLQRQGIEFRNEAHGARSTNWRCLANTSRRASDISSWRFWRSR